MNMTAIFKAYPAEQSIRENIEVKKCLQIENELFVYHKDSAGRFCISNFRTGLLCTCADKLKEAKANLFEYIDRVGWEDLKRHIETCEQVN